MNAFTMTPMTDEARRLARLNELMVLDTPPDPLLDRIVAWAAQACGTPIALVSLVDAERQWFKARHGLPDVTQTPRSQAFCAHAIGGEALFEVPDARLDERFADNPLVIGEPGIAFYAGVPLTMAGGERIGTLCVIDRRPRALSAAQADTLRRLAGLVRDAIVMRGQLVSQALAARTAYERALAASEAQHRLIVEGQSELISLASADGVLTYVNPAYARCLGLTPRDLVGRSLYDFVDDEHRDLVRDRIEWVVTCGEAIVGENRMRDGRGGETWIAWTNSLHVQTDGQRCVRSVGRDISARRRAETALRASEDFLRRTGRVAGVGGWELDLASGSVTWSDETRRIHEVGADFEPTLASALAFYDQPYRSQLAAAVDTAIAAGQGWDLVLAIRSAGGRAKWVRAVGEVEFVDGRPVRLVGALQDVSELRAMERRIAQSERFVREVTDNLSVRIAYVDRDRRHRFVNQTYCDRFGLPRERLLGRTRAELLDGAEMPEVETRVDAVLAGEPQRFEFEEVVGGRRLRIDSRLRPDRDADGQVRGFFATGIDITDRHRDEQALRVLTTVLEQSTDFILQTDPNGRLLYMNPAARRVVGVALDDPLAQRGVSEFNTERTNRQIVQELRPAVQRDGVWRGETEVRRADGSVMPVSHLAIAHRDADGRLVRYSSVLRDISGEVATRLEMERQAATLRSVTEALPVIVWAVDAGLCWRFVNSAFEQWSGLCRDDIVGRSAATLLASDDADPGAAWTRRALDGESVHFERHYSERPGQPTFSFSYIPVRLEDGRTDGFVGVGYDITPHRAEQTRLRSLAERDALTGLLNRAGFHAALTEAMRAGHAAELALLYVDLDHFKPVNDLHGHAAGDAVLSAFAHRLTEIVRPTDTIARLGGDEFALLLWGVRSQRDAESVAAKVVDAAARPIPFGNHQIRIGTSVGLAVGAASGGDGTDLIRRADAQLYRAKSGGRGRHATEDAQADSPGAEDGRTADAGRRGWPVAAGADEDRS